LRRLGRCIRTQDPGHLTQLPWHSGEWHLCRCMQRGVRHVWASFHLHLQRRPLPGPWLAHLRGEALRPCLSRRGWRHARLQRRAHWGDLHGNLRGGLLLPPWRGAADLHLHGDGGPGGQQPGLRGTALLCTATPWLRLSSGGSGGRLRGVEDWAALPGGLCRGLDAPKQCTGVHLRGLRQL